MHLLEYHKLDHKFKQIFIPSKFNIYLQNSTHLHSTPRIHYNRTTFSHCLLLLIISLTHSTPSPELLNISATAFIVLVIPLQSPIKCSIVSLFPVHNPQLFSSSFFQYLFLLPSLSYLNLAINFWSPPPYSIVRYFEISSAA